MSSKRNNTYNGGGGNGNYNKSNARGPPRERNPRQIQRANYGNNYNDDPFPHINIFM